MESLVWLVNGVESKSSWAVGGAGVVNNVLEIGSLAHHHHHARLTCRLTTHSNKHVAANITDVSVTVTMYREWDVISSETRVFPFSSFESFKSSDGIKIGHKRLLKV